MNTLCIRSIALVAIAALAACEKQEPPTGAGLKDVVQPVEVMPVKRMSLQETTQLVGTIAANESADLRTEYPGVVAEVYFQEGMKVSKGDKLIKLDARELEAQLAQAKAGLVLATKTLERNRRLLEDRAVSELEVDAAEAEQARLKALLEGLEVKLAKAIITAPFDGVVGGRPVSVGDYLTPQSLITTVDDLSRLKVEMEVPERYLPLLQAGSRFELSAATLSEDGQTTGEVYFVSPRIDVETRSALVKGYIPEPTAALKPGMFANITLVLREVEDALVVAESAVLSTAKGSVLIKPDGPEGEQVAAFVPVKLGIRVPGYVQITPVGPPLKEGDKVVSAGVGGLILFPGRKLKPVDAVVMPEKPAITERELE